MYQKTCWPGTDENVDYTLALNFKILNKVTISVREGYKAEKFKNSGREVKYGVKENKAKS